MKMSAGKTTLEVLQKIETIEKELKDLKSTILKKSTPSGKKVVALKGILKGVKITEKDIEQAKKSLYSKVKI